MDDAKKILADSQTMIIFIALVSLTIITATLLSRYLQKQIIKRTKGHQVDITSFVFLKHMVVTIVYFLGFGWALLSLPITRTFAHSLLAGAGATTLILGFASQQLFNNLISGVFIVINRPFKINDRIEFRGSQGKVIEINLNSTLLEDENGDTIVIPSSLILSDKVKIIRATSDKNN